MNRNEPKIIMRNVRAWGNGGDGIRSNIPIDMNNVESFNNGGAGINLDSDPALDTAKPMYFVAIGKWIAGIVAAIIASLILAYVFGIGR